MRDHKLQQTGPLRGDDKAIPAAPPEKPNQDRDSRTAQQLGNTHASRRPGRWGGIPGRRRRLYRLDPRQENSLPALRCAKPAVCLQAVPVRRVEKRCPGFVLPEPDPESVPKSEPELKLEPEPGSVRTQSKPPLQRS